MSNGSWVFVTDEKWSGVLSAARGVPGPVTAVVVGPRELADAVAAAGPDEVLWVDCPLEVPAEAYAAAAAAAAAQADPRVLISSVEPSARGLLGAAAAAVGAAVVPAVLGFGVDGDQVVVRRSAVGGAIVAIDIAAGPVAGVYGGEDAEVPVGSAPATVTALAVEPGDLRITARESEPGASGLADAAVVVSFGRGVRAKEDIALIRRLADAVGGELACSMPVADDLGWLPKERYVGRSGQQLSPRLYLAIGIDGAPQHMEGVRGAQIVAAVNNNPDARIFKTSDYGIVGDLYEVVPALIEALQ